MTLFTKKQLLILIATLLLSNAVSAGSFIINQVAGFTDSTPATPVGGNTGTTVGAQRAIAMAYVASQWTTILQPSVNIVIDVQFSSSLFCDATGVVLGSTGVTSQKRDLAGLPYASTWYPQALAEHLTGNASGTAAISSAFNSKLTGLANCFNGAVWYYGLDHNIGLNKIDFIQIAAHEIAHGLGFSTPVNLTTGAKFKDALSCSSGCDDIYLKFLRDNSLNKNWPTMTDTERVTSAKDNGDLVWTGNHVQHVLSTLNNGLTNNYPRIYAPAALSVGSSVCHWDTNVTYLGDLNELMEYQPNKYYDMALTVALMRDLGWTTANYDFDKDGTNDEQDDFPQTNAANKDTDGDGMVDNWLAGSGCSGSSCAGLVLDGDDDGDGVPDTVDAAPLNSSNTTEVNLPLNAAYKGSQYSSSLQQQ